MRRQEPPAEPESRSTDNSSFERIRVGGEEYLLASAVAARRPRVFLTHGDSFAIFDLGGDIPLSVREAFGLFFCGTRHLSRLELRLNDNFPTLLSCSVRQDGAELISHLCNPDRRREGTTVLERETIAVLRSRTLAAGRLHERVQLQNYGRTAVSVKIEMVFEADFADIFEVRGITRRRHGTYHKPQVQRGAVRFRYDGLDHVSRETVIMFAPAPAHVDLNRATYEVQLPAHGTSLIELSVTCVNGNGSGPRPFENYERALANVRRERAAWRREFPELYSNNEGFNDLINRSRHDLAVLRTKGPWGSYVYAGIPWFATIFGRDGLITALETLAFAPKLAAATLRTLAALQGARADPGRDEEPGKIVHEIRRGEMAATGEIPFARYYGSVDSTPLFLVLLAAYVERTADIELGRELWSAATAALRWIERYGDADGDGYVEYERKSERGLINQGWKDSHDAISHEDGTLAEAPIALAEVQGYTYAAYRGMARLAKRLQHRTEAAAWEARAVDLQRRFNHDFWLPDKQTFALALDRHKRACRVVASNAAHCLFTGIAEADKGAKLAARLMREDMFSGWGLRTLAETEQRYNPMSYHNGSIWPHDTAIAAAGFARYGMGELTARVMTALFEASLAVEDHRLPELFCGFARRSEHEPVPYPVACRPQAWAAGSVYLLIQASLGLSVNAWERRVVFHNTHFPPWLERLDIHGLVVADAELDMSITRGRWGASVEVLHKRGEASVVVRQ